MQYTTQTQPTTALTTVTPFEWTNRAKAVAAAAANANSSYLAGYGQETWDEADEVERDAANCEVNVKMRVVEYALATVFAYETGCQTHGAKVPVAEWKALAADVLQLLQSRYGW